MHKLVWGVLALTLGLAGCMRAGQLAQGSQKLHANHLGYDRLAPKRAVVESNGALSRFEVVDVKAKRTELEGALTPVVGFTEWGGAPGYYVADFSALTRPGAYQLRVNGTVSAPFGVADQLLFHSTARAVIEYFQQMRAGPLDTAVWSADAQVRFIDRPGRHDVRGGWYDASGDISKYLTHLSYANFMNPQQIPLVAWAFAWVHDNAPGLLKVSELSAAVEAEALWGADFLVRMQDDSGFFYATVFDGWSGKPGQRKISAFSGLEGAQNARYQAAFREGGGMAIAALARIAHWGVASQGVTPARYLEAAKRGFAHLLAHNLEYCDDGKENIIDDYAALLAASELMRATGESEYLEAARARASALAKRLHPSGYFIADAGSRPFWHASDAGLPVVALANYLELESDEAARATARQAIQTHLDYLVSVTQAVPNPFGYARQHTAPGVSAFFVPHGNESGYWWQGENARLSSLAAAALIGARALGLSGSEKPAAASLSRLAADQLDWVLGKNPYDVCMLNGFGRNNPARYGGDKPESGTLPGGIANGITSREADGAGIQWDRRGAEDWKRWRWIEQWLPHAAWYLVAVTALAEAGVDQAQRLVPRRHRVDGAISEPQG